jgi:hypothetical protein
MSRYITVVLIFKNGSAVIFMTRTSLQTIILVGINHAIRLMCGIQIGTAKQLSIHAEWFEYHAL